MFFSCAEVLVPIVVLVLIVLLFINSSNLYPLVDVNVVLLLYTSVLCLFFYIILLDLSLYVYGWDRLC